MKTWIPWLHGNPNATPADPAPKLDCLMHVDALLLVDLWLAALGARATDMACDARLVQAAQSHADWLAAHYVSGSRHIGQDGSTANERVRAAGYQLPDYYAEAGNSVESVVWVTLTSNPNVPPPATRGWESLYNSPPHYVHLMREGAFAQHTVFGVGAGHSAKAITYVLVSAPPE